MSRGHEPSPGKPSAPHQSHLDVNLQWSKTTWLLAYLLPSVFLQRNQETLGLFFFPEKDNKVSAGIGPNILWPGFNARTKGERASAPTSFVPIEKRTVSHRRVATRNKLDYLLCSIEDDLPAPPALSSQRPLTPVPFVRLPSHAVRR